MDWQIREARPADAERLRACMESAYSGYQSRMGGRRLPPMDADYETEISAYPTWVVESAENILGALIMDFSDDQATIANIAVDPAFQGQGIGGALMRLAEGAARKRGFKTLRLATHPLLTENVELYRHLGWRETFRDDNRVLMQKSI